MVQFGWKIMGHSTHAISKIHKYPLINNVCQSFTEWGSFYSWSLPIDGWYWFHKPMKSMESDSRWVTVYEDGGHIGHHWKLKKCNDGNFVISGGIGVCHLSLRPLVIAKLVWWLSDSNDTSSLACVQMGKQGYNPVHLLRYAHGFVVLCYCLAL